ncbi:heme-degrading monooxygenase HmoA [Halospina denitrificans]|uniref:Heme-degrading monooxygenase HmoA n=1 Tax=Halospina denitrificans TaxID=332522 RepID=A0A4R7JNV3_9GAMM|nr:antibiotic biosynthesis monooxygenase family protein [Halospina denitrificans]TDT39404.1 heme-degrading monooxygenase HmoA [Halospina denitrificans]
MIRVIIERQIAQEMERTYEEHARQALKNAIEIPGFVSGESLKDERDPNHRVILSSWRSAADWYRWQSSPERREMMGRIRPMLETDERIVVLDYALPTGNL